MKRKLDINDIFRIKTMRENGFDIVEGWSVAIKDSKKGPIIKDLANFVAWPSKEVMYDNGVESSRCFDVKGILATGKELPEVRLTHAEFFGALPLALTKQWGIDVIIKKGAKEDLREAMQILGRRRKQETVYTYTGWRQIEGKWVFLHAGGAVGLENARVDLNEGGEGLKRYALPVRCEQPREAADTAFATLKLAKPEIVYPLFATVFFAPLCEVLRPYSLEADFMLFLIGRTQSGKSSLAALFLSFFGDFDKNHFPANYRQTANSLERVSFLLKDVMTVVDDFFPGQSQQEREKMKELAQRLARAYGDGAVRQRISGNKLQKSWLPRGLAISTGEERPEIGESGQARFAFVDVNRGDVNYDALIELQRERKGQLAEFMLLYIEWIAKNWNRIPQLFQETYRKAQEMLISEEYSGRINESVAKLCGATDVVLTFAKESGFINQEQYIQHRKEAFDSFYKLLEINVKSLVDEKPSQKFMATLTEIYRQESWRFCDIGDKKQPEGFIGCYDEHYLYLLPTQCFQAIQARSRAEGLPFPVGMKTLWRHLRTEGIIESTDSRGRNTVQERVACLGGRNVDVLKLSLTHLEKE